MDSEIRNYPLNVWYQAGWGHELAPGATLARTLLDTPVLLLRGTDGQVRALLDRCPHRFVPLSLGKYDGQTVTCAYHGLGFDGAGQCVHNPHGPLPPQSRLPSYPVVERHAALWIWLGDAGKADPALIPDVGFIDPAPETARGYGLMEMPANWQLIVDNLLDLAHADYLHPAFGDFTTTAKMSWKEQPEGMVLRWEASDCTVPPIFKALVPEGNADMWVQSSWLAPAVIGIDAGATPPGSAPRGNMYSYHALTPQTATTTHYFYLFTRNFLTEDTALTARVNAFGAHAFQNEDKPVIAAQQSRVGTRNLMDMQPVLLAVDAGVARARRKIKEIIDTVG